MSADCLFVLRNPCNEDAVKKVIIDKAAEHGCGIWSEPVNGLICCNQIPIDDGDVLFEPTDSVDTIDSELLLVPTGCTVNGQRAGLPLYERLLIIQDLAECCLNFSEHIEIYISFDNPFLPDFTVYHTTYSQIADILLSEYRKNEAPYATIPDVCLHISRSL